MSETTLPEIDMLLIGHMAADIVPGGFMLGGTVAYCAAAAIPFGLRVGVITSARKDEPLLDQLRQYAHVVNIPAEQTTTFNNVYTPQGRIQYWPARAAMILPEHVPSEWLKTRLVHLGALSDDIHLDVCTMFPESTSILVTPQGWMRNRAPDHQVIWKPWFDKALLQRASMVVISEEDIAEAPEMRKKYADITPLLVVTNGEKGGTYYVKGERREYDAVDLPIVDLTGAGDTFATAAFMGWVRCGQDPDAAMKVGAYLAACGISRLSLDSAPTSEEIQQAYDYAGSACAEGK